MVKLIQEAQQKAPGEALELLEVHSGGAQDGVDGISDGAFEPIAFESMLALQVPYGGLDRCSPFHPTP